MRVLRGALVGALALAMTVAIPSTAAQAAPTAPYTVLTVDGSGKSRTLDPSNSTIQIVNPASDPDQEWFYVTANGADSSAAGYIGVQAPTGTLLETGREYQTTRFGDATHAGLDVTVDHTSCGGTQTGTMTVHEITRDPDSNDVTNVALSYHQICSGLDVKGELRYGSDLDYRSATVDPMTKNWGDVYLGETGPNVTVTVTGRGSTPITMGAASITGTGARHYSIVSTTCTGVTLAYGQTCAVTVKAAPLSAGALLATLVIPDNSTAGQRSMPLRINGVAGYKGRYVPVAPQRIMDTRTGLGTTKGAIGSGSTRHLTVGGRAQLPAGGVGAVVLNVTVTQPTASGHLTVYPYGVSRPTASSINFQKGWTRANSVTVGVGSDRVSIYNHTGSTHVVVDVAGYYIKDQTNLSGMASGQLQPTVPQRILDTKAEWGEKLPGGWYVTMPVSYGADINPHITALAVNITAVQPESSGYLTAWNGASDPPIASSLNYTRGSVVPNMAVVPVSPCYDCGSAVYPAISIYTLATTHILVDIVGFFDDGTLSDGLRFRAATPTRILDTRHGTGYPSAIGGGKTAKITTPGSIATADTEMLALNVTAVRPTSNTYLTIWPEGITGIPRPTVSNLNPFAGQVVANAALTLIGPTNAFNVYNNSGSIDVVADVVGTFWLYPGTASLSTAGQQGLQSGGLPANRQLQATLPGPRKAQA